MVVSNLTRRWWGVLPVYLLLDALRAREKGNPTTRVPGLGSSFGHPAPVVRT